MPKNFTRRMNFERRAIVAIACYFLVMQAFLAALAGGFAAGGFAAGGIGAAGIGGGSELANAIICHGAGTAPDAPEGDGKPKFLCGLCVLATSGDTPPPVPADFIPAARAVTRVVASAEFAPSLSSFDPRAGRSRAPPVLALS
jgi:hypothetical protein